MLTRLFLEAHTIHLFGTNLMRVLRRLHLTGETNYFLLTPVEGDF
jgi:hypothetical protein